MIENLMHDVWKQSTHPVGVNNSFRSDRSVKHIVLPAHSGWLL